MIFAKVIEQGFRSWSALRNVLLILFIMSCASLTEEERQDRNNRTIDHYNACRAMYARAGRAWVSDVTYYGMRGPTPLDMRFEMGMNHCRIRERE